MSLDSYMGEFLISPVPLEMSLHYCSFGCAYCFANLNLRTRRADMETLLRLLSDFDERQTLVAHWLQGGYPVCFSNRVDPFATSNIRDSLVLIERLVEKEIPLQFQTRGPHARHAREFASAFAMLPGPCMWYVTIEMWDDALRQKVAPGAPSIPARLELIEFLVSEGHTVVVGINPLVPEWLPEGDVDKLLEALKRCGVWGVWTERLHFSRRQVGAMTSRERRALGQPLIERVRTRITPAEDRAMLDQVRAQILDIGLELFSVGQPNRSEFFAPYHQLYRTIPTMQDWINHCHEHLAPRDWITWTMFRDFFVPHLPPGVWPIDAYLGATTHQLWRTHHVAPQMTYEDLLRIIFVEPRYKMCPTRLPSFAYAGVWTDEGWIRLTDTVGMPYLIWSPEGSHTDYYTHVEEAETIVLEQEVA